MNKSQYKALVKKTQTRITELEKQAEDALQEAINLSNQTGVPFDFRVGNFAGGYIPKSLPKFDADFLSEVTGFDSYHLGEDDGYMDYGWLSSYC